MNNKIKYNLILLLTVIVSIFLKINNPGLMLMLLIYFGGIGIIYLGIFYVATHRIINIITESDNYNEVKKAKIFFYISCITLIIFNLFCQESSDGGTIYYFGKAYNGENGGLYNTISFISIIINIILTFINWNYGKIYKKTRRLHSNYTTDLNNDNNNISDNNND